MTVKMVKLSDPELWPRASCRECRANFSPNTSHFSTAAQGIRYLSFNFWKLKTNFIKRTLLPFFTKKGGLWIFLLGGCFFFMTKKRVQCDPNILIPWPRCDNYGSNQLPVKLQSIYFSIVPSLHKWEKMSYLLACLGQEPSSFFLSMMISWPEKRPASWQLHLLCYTFSKCLTNGRTNLVPEQYCPALPIAHKCC